jgi:hypothetical protein
MLDLRKIFDPDRRAKKPAITTDGGVGSPAGGTEDAQSVTPMPPRPEEARHMSGEATRPETAAREAAIDEAAAPYYGNDVPPPLSDDTDFLLETLFNNGCSLTTPFPAPDVITMQCPVCGRDGALEIRESKDGVPIIDSTCGCAPPIWFETYPRRAVWQWTPKPLSERWPTGGPCRCCGETSHWVSVCGLFVCRRCHPPAPGAERH